jgi:hypothetical protein
MDITLSYLSYKSYETLRNTLQSHKELLEIVAEKQIYFQEINETDLEFAEKYNLEFFGTTQNTGIRGGLIELLNNCRTKYFLFLENDFELIESIDTCKRVFSDCIDLIENKDIKVVRLRHELYPGDPLYSRPIDFEHLGGLKLEAVYRHNDLSELYPGIVHRFDLNYPYFYTTSNNAQWSNNVFICKTEWLKNIINQISNDNEEVDFMLEPTLVNHSLRNNYLVAHGKGLFTHNRIDR